MRVVVTGGTGNIGRYVCDELTEAGYETIAVDRAKPRQGKVPARFVQADLTSLDETLKALSGAGQVVHLAAIPNPANDPPEVVLRDNTTATYNVFEAARRHGIPRVVYASSESATGFGIHEVKLKPQYVPIDEAHPCWPHECYSLSKYLGEQIAQGYGQAYGIECIALRWCGVWDRRVADWVPQLIERTESGELQEPPWFGSYIAVRDVARACRLAVACELPENSHFEACFLTARDTFHPLPTLDVLGRIYPQPPTVRDPQYYELNAFAPVFDLRKAERLLHWTPQHHLRDFAQWEL